MACVSSLCWISKFWRLGLAVFPFICIILCTFFWQTTDDGLISNLHYTHSSRNIGKNILEPLSQSLQVDAGVKEAKGILAEAGWKILQNKIETERSCWLPEVAFKAFFHMHTQIACLNNNNNNKKHESFLFYMEPKKAD